MYSNMFLGASAFLVCVYICNGVTESSALLHAWCIVAVHTYVRTCHESCIVLSLCSASNHLMLLRVRLSMHEQQ